MFEIKFIIIYLLIAIVIFIIIKEFISLKNTVKENNEKIKSLSYSSSKNIENKMRENFTSCIDEIKLLNSNYLVQIRRMNDYEKDNIITTNSNNYTDSETIAKNKTNKILYLSDGFETNEVKNDFKIKYSDFTPSKIIKDGPISEIDIAAELININCSNDNNNNNNNDSNIEHEESEIDSDTNSTSEITKKSVHESIISFDELDNNDNDNDVENMIIYNNLSKNKTENKFELLPIENYNKKSLEKFAKEYNIPTYYKEGEKRKVLQKDALYEKIKEKINNK